MSSWFKRGVSTTVSNVIHQDNRHSASSAVPYHVATNSRTVAKSQSGHNRSVLSQSGSSESHIRAAADSAYLLHTVNSLWNTVEVVLNRHDVGPSENEMAAVVSFATEVATGLECHNTTAHMQITDFLLMVDAMDKVRSWLFRYMKIIGVEAADLLALLQLRIYDLLLSHSERCLLTEKRLMLPLLKLLMLSGPSKNSAIEDQLALVLHQLCVGVSQFPASLELLFDSVSSMTDGLDSSLHKGMSGNQFLVFSLLIPYVHLEGLIAQQARDDLLLIMSLSSSHNSIGQHIVEKSDFCPLLATGLSALYSSLPRRIDYSSDDWNHLTPDDIAACPALGLFINSLEFCNAVIQVAHPYVCESLKKYVYDGFLVSVLGPALHQNSIDFFGRDWIDDDPAENSTSSMEEVIAATAYLELFIRKTSDPGLLQTFLHFILFGKLDDVYIIDSLICRIYSSARLCMVTLTLLKTLVELNNEEVMFHLVFKYLVPCTHVMISQQKCVSDLDNYCKVAEKLISLMPLCFSIRLPPDGSASLPEREEVQKENVLTNAPTPDVTTNTPLTQSPSMTSSVLTPLQRTGAKLLSSIRRKPRNQPSGDDVSLDSSSGSIDSNIRQLNTSGPTLLTSLHTENVVCETSYMEYLLGARLLIAECMSATVSWSAPYDGQNPPPSVSKPAVQVTSDASDTITRENGKIDDSIAAKSDLPSETGNDVSSSAPVNADHHQNELTTSSTTETDEQAANSTVTGCGENGGNWKDDKASSVAIVDTDSYNTAVTSDRSVTINADNSQSLQKSSNSKKPVNASVSDDFELFLRQLSRVHANVSPGDEDILTAFDKLIDNLSERYQSQQQQISSPVDVDVRDAGGVKGRIDDDAETGKWDGNVVDAHGSVSTANLNVNQAAPNVDSKQSFPASSSSSDALTASSSVKTGGAQASSVEQLCRFQSSDYPASSPLPSIGPFLTALLGKLDLMVQNPLYVNLQLTGLLSRLACFPQPLLRSLLLSHSLVFQPSIKSLIQVLRTVKHQLDNYLLTVPDYDILLNQAGQYLMWRDDIGKMEGGTGDSRRDSVLFQPSRQSLAAGDKRRASTALNDMLRFKSLRGVADQTRLTLDSRGVHYINRQGSPGVDGRATDNLEVRTKNAIYCALIFKEFIKELAAISQEHLLIQAESLSASEHWFQH